MQRHHHFIFHLTVGLIGGMVALALGLLYYYDLQDHFLAQAANEITPRQYMHFRAAEEGLDADLLDHIIRCESGWRMVQNSKSSAYGYFQIIDGTEKGTPQYKAGLRKTDPYVNIDMGIYLYQRSSWLPWLESKPCWGSRYSQY
jgi:soluble lytic murein transglycosylase-like protein